MALAHTPGEWRDRESAGACTRDRLEEGWSGGYYSYQAEGMQPRTAARVDFLTLRKGEQFIEVDFEIGRKASSE